MLLHRHLLLVVTLLAPGYFGCDPVEPTPSPDRERAPDSATATSVRNAPPPPLPTIDIPSSLVLSAQERLAVQDLARSPHFGGWAVGVAGTPTAPVSAFRVLYASTRASEGFALVLEHGTLAGQLMALAGLYLTDPARYHKELPRYRGRTETVRVMTSGCMPGGDPVAVAEVVESPKAVRLSGPEDTLATWSAQNPGKPIQGFDIVGGGYSAVMRPHRPAVAPTPSSSSAK